MDVLIVGEDEVTKAIIRRVITDYREDIVITNELPARGGQIQKFAPNFNKLNAPVILLTDLDQYDCAPTLIKEWFKEPITPQFCFRVACDEAEGWLMSDREGFSSWIGVNPDLIPQPSIINKRKGHLEIRFGMKPSLYMMMKLATKSRIAHLRQDLIPVKGASKGRGYNAALLPFIQTRWDIENARGNSDSLNRAIQRIEKFK